MGLKIDFINSNSCKIEAGLGYTPIDCDTYDYLEMWAMHKSSLMVQTVFNDITYQDVYITRIETIHQKEFVSLSNGLTMRLDQIHFIEAKA